MMKNDARILDARLLVATDNTDDASLVKRLLAEDFDNVTLSTNPERTVADFEKTRPAVLILAFNTLEKAERYYLGLYRLSSLIHTLPHRTLILCNADDVLRVFDLCKKEYFDDYILFWPMTHDAPRLRMAVILALRQMAAADGPSAQKAMAAQARRLAELEAVVQRYESRGERQADEAADSVRQAEQGIGSALDHFSRRLAEGEHPDLVEVKNSVGLEQEINRMKAEEIGRHFKSISVAVTPMRQWATELKKELGPHLESAKALSVMAEHIRPLVLIVDDDEFQHKLLAQLLRDMKLDLAHASAGIEALTLLHRRKPDLILMDIGLTDVSGVEVTRRIKQTPPYADIPVIMITGDSEKEVVMESLKAGAVDFLVKPFDKTILLEKIHKYLGVEAH